MAQSFVNGRTSDSRTLGEARSRGFELEADMRLTDSLALRAAFTDLDVEITEFASDPGFVGKTPQSVVERFALLEPTHIPIAMPELELRLGASYQGDS